MSRFEFRLARLVRVRASEERLARAEWAAAERRAAEAEERRRSLQGEIAAARTELADELARGQPLSPPRLGISHRALDGLVGALRSRTERALTLRAQADAEARFWRERRARHRALEELEQRARSLHDRAQAAREAAALEAQATARRGREGVPGAGGPEAGKDSRAG